MDLIPPQHDDHAQDVCVAVVVTYNPSLDGLARLLAAVSPQVARILVVDNASRNAQAIERLVATMPNARFTGLSDNTGIAHAQNVGIRAAHGAGASCVLTLDQDSVPQPNMVRNLALVLAQADDSRRIAAVGPLLKDEHTQLPLPFFSYSQGRKDRITPVEGDDVLDVEFLVSSGTLLSMAALVEVGLMRDELFIAYVDVEWCLRARSRGYRILACCRTSMDHNLGERRLRIGRRVIPLHSALRHFYMLRSGIYMQRLAHVGATWKRADRRQLARSFILFSLAGLPRLQEFASMCRGFAAGLRMRLQAAPMLTCEQTSNPASRH